MYGYRRRCGQLADTRASSLISSGKGLGGLGYGEAAVRVRTRATDAYAISANRLTHLHIIRVSTMEDVFERASSSDILVQERRFNVHVLTVQVSILPGELANLCGLFPLYFVRFSRNPLSGITSFWTFISLAIRASAATLASSMTDSSIYNQLHVPYTLESRVRFRISPTESCVFSV